MSPTGRDELYGRRRRAPARRVLQVEDAATAGKAGGPTRQHGHLLPAALEEIRALSSYRRGEPAHRARHARHASQSRALTEEHRLHARALDLAAERAVREERDHGVDAVLGQVTDAGQERALGARARARALDEEHPEPASSHAAGSYW